MLCTYTAVTMKIATLTMNLFGAVAFIAAIPQAHAESADAGTWRGVEVVSNECSHVSLSSTAGRCQNRQENA